jgi:DNA-binding SARP family transcriptional activator
MPALHGARALPLLDSALLTWLALEGPTDRVRLSAVLWPQSDSQAARNSLRQRLFKLRRLCGVALVHGAGTLALAEGVTHDLEDADSVLGNGSVSIGPEFDTWLAHQRERRRDRQSATLAELSEMAERAGDWRDALAHAHELLAMAPLSEEAHRRLMRLHYLSGDRSAALLAFDRCERMLKDEVGTRPDAQTMALLRTVELAQDAAPTGYRSSQPVPASVLRPPQMIGREAESAALMQAWTQGQSAVVLGDGGLGKTRLLGEFLQEGALMVLAQPGDKRVPYATASRMLRQLPRETLLAVDPLLHGDLAHLLPELGSPSGYRGEYERTRLLNAAVTLLTAGSRPVWRGIVDDLHFADDASIELLQYICSQLDGGWIVAARDVELSASGKVWIADLQALQTTSTILLQPLTLSQVELVVDSLGISSLSGSKAAARLFRHTGGNPMYLLETVKAWLAQGADVRLGETGSQPHSLPAPPNVLKMIGRRIGQLSTAAIRLARCAAISKPDFSIELAAQVLRLRTVDLADPWAELEAAHVLHDGAFAHDLIFEATLASVPPPVARRLHADIAAILEQQGCAPSNVAAHWQAAAVSGRPTLAVPA